MCNEHISIATFEIRSRKWIDKRQNEMRREAKKKKLLRICHQQVDMNFLII